MENSGGLAKTQAVPIIILAGGQGSRISEESHLYPKPMIEIGDRPILIHIMQHYYRFGFNNFIICAGYKAWDIKNFFLHYQSRLNHLEINHIENPNLPPLRFGSNRAQERWRVRVLDTGKETSTGGRVAAALDALATDTFYDFGVTYGDGLSNVPLDSELDFHLQHGRIGTVLGVQPSARFGDLSLTDGDPTCVSAFSEKSKDSKGVINGGFFFFKRSFREFLDPHPDCILERAPLESLARERQLMVYHHTGFWQPMDTLREKHLLQDLWLSGKAPWLS